MINAESECEDSIKRRSGEEGDMMDKRKAQSIIIMIVALILAALFMLSIMKNYADDVGDNLR